MIKKCVMTMQRNERLLKWIDERINTAALSLRSAPQDQEILNYQIELWEDMKKTVRGESE